MSTLRRMWTLWWMGIVGAAAFCAAVAICLGILFSLIWLWDHAVVLYWMAGIAFLPVLSGKMFAPMITELIEDIKDPDGAEARHEERMKRSRWG